MFVTYDWAQSIRTPDAWNMSIKTRWGSPFNERPSPSNLTPALCTNRLVRQNRMLCLHWNTDSTRKKKIYNKIELTYQRIFAFSYSWREKILKYWFGFFLQQWSVNGQDSMLKVHWHPVNQYIMDAKLVDYHKIAWESISTEVDYHPRDILPMESRKKDNLYVRKIWLIGVYKMYHKIYYERQ